MPSFDAINYSLRPSKTIQRKIVFSGVRILQNHLHLERMAYIGFGSIWFTDFTLAHKLLGVDDMISIEGNDIGYQRAVFNAPYATVKVEHGYSNDILPSPHRRPPRSLFAPGNPLPAALARQWLVQISCTPSR